VRLERGQLGLYALRFPVFSKYSPRAWPAQRRQRVADRQGARIDAGRSEGRLLALHHDGAAFQAQFHSPGELVGQPALWLSLPCLRLAALGFLHLFVAPLHLPAELGYGDFQSVLLPARVRRIPPRDIAHSATVAGSPVLPANTRAAKRATGGGPTACPRSGFRKRQVAAPEHESDVPFVPLRAVRRLHRMDRVVQEVEFTRPGAVQHADDAQQGEFSRDEEVGLDSTRTNSRGCP